MTRLEHMQSAAEEGEQMLSKLKPCPFCGSEAALIIKPFDGGYEATIHCLGGPIVGCFAKMRHWAINRRLVIEGAKKAWNRREGNDGR